MNVSMPTVLLAIKTFSETRYDFYSPEAYALTALARWLQEECTEMFTDPNEDLIEKLQAENAALRAQLDAAES